MVHLPLPLVLLLAVRGLAAPTTYAPVSADPNEWDPDHPPPAAEWLPGYGRPETQQLLVPDPDNDGNTANLTKAEEEAWQWPAAANCPVDDIRNWSCGVNCERPGVVHVLYAGGDDKAVPTWYVGVSGPTAIVAFKGTNTDSLRSLLNDAKFLKDDTDEIQVKGADGKDRDAFPDSNHVEIHKGFRDVFDKVQPEMDRGVREAFADGATRILVVGHSLGAAVAQLSAVYLQHEFPNVTVSARTFGTPRVGDGDWADYVDSTLGNRSLYMVNEDDMVPHLPPKLFNYRHSSNQVWRKDNDTGWEWCNGQENDDCADSVDGKFSKRHDGPYVGVMMDCVQPADTGAPEVKSTNWTDTGLADTKS